MPDWRRYVRENLKLAKAAPEMEADAVDEIARQLEDAYLDGLRSGLSAQEAERQAKLHISDWHAFAADLHKIPRYRSSPEDRKAGWTAFLTQDLRYGLRRLRQKPGFTVVALLILAIAIGANTLIFTIVNSLLLRALPYPDSDRIVVIWSTPPNHPEQTFPGTSGAYVLLRDNSRLFETVGAARLYEMFTVAENSDGAEWERVEAQWFTQEMVQVLGVPPLLGRWPDTSDDINGAFVVISHALWQRKLGGAADIVGKKLLLDLGPATVTGVMPPGFELLNPNAQIWIRQGVQGQALRSPNRIFTALGRLKPGVTLQQAQSEVSAIAQKLTEEVPEVHLGWGLRVESLQDVYIGRIRTPLLIFQGAVFMVLVIACANVAGLLLAQAVSRRKELAIRAAIGSNRWRIVRQLVVETVLLTLAGGILGLSFAWAGLKTFIRFGPQDFPRLGEIGMDIEVFGFALLLSLGTGLVFGALPSLQISGLQLMNVLRETTRSASANPIRQRMRSGFVVVQISLAMVLLIGSGLMVNSLYRVSAAQVGFTPRDLVALQIPYPRSAFYKGLGNTPAGGIMVELDPKFMRVTEGIRDRLKNVPGVTSVTAGTTPPLGGAARRLNFVREDTPIAPSDREAWSAEWYPVTADYFETVQIPLIRGRVIDVGDTAARPPVIVINSALAERFFPKDDPVGKTLQLDLLDDRPRAIIGIVGAIRQNRYDTHEQPQVYVPQDQLARRMDLNVARQLMVQTFIVRTNGAPPMSELRAAIREVDRTLAISSLRTVEEYAGAQLQDLRQYTALFTMFGAISVVLSVIGLFGIMAHAVSQRTNEIGIRIALGAPSASVLGLVLRQGVALIAIGLGLGLMAALTLTRIIQNLLWGITPTDPMTFALVLLFLAVVALLACYIPARRALKVDPITALRME